jgi:glutamate-ammonia-ligase adenylyltransferase
MMNISEQWQSILSSASQALSAEKVLVASDFVTQWGHRQPKAAKLFVASGVLETIYTDDEMTTQLASALTDVADETALHRQLRLFRQQQMVRIIWRDIAGWADLAETVRDLSAMADACISQALNLLHKWQSESLGSPTNAEGVEQELLVIGMGKLGAGELNLSSDIDLIFAYPEDGETQGGRK